MPELPEVETVRRGLSPAMVGARFAAVQTRRRDLRYPLPSRFKARLTGAKVLELARRGKYLLAPLSTGETLIMHLGMSGRFTIHDNSSLRAADYYLGEDATDPRHDHVVFEMHGARKFRVVFNDPRRFGLMDLCAAGSQSKHLVGLGPEPLGDAFTAANFSATLRAKKQMSIKAALLDQHVVAGVGNIYASEALHRAGISPRRMARTVSISRGIALRDAVVAVLTEAIEAGGSTLNDFAAADGAEGRYQGRFRVYDREGERCHQCGGKVKRIVQAGRSTFYCGTCQK
jgi:formamidopyrimidine-DNA glycosylase